MDINIFTFQQCECWNSSIYTSIESDIPKQNMEKWKNPEVALHIVRTNAVMVQSPALQQKRGKGNGRGEEGKGKTKGEKGKRKGKGRNGKYLQAAVL